MRGGVHHDDTYMTPPGRPDFVTFRQKIEGWLLLSLKGYRKPVGSGLCILIPGGESSQWVL